MSRVLKAQEVKERKVLKAESVARAKAVRDKADTRKSPEARDYREINRDFQGTC